MWMIGVSMITSFAIDIISVNNYIDKDEPLWHTRLATADLANIVTNSLIVGITSGLMEND